MSAPRLFSRTMCLLFWQAIWAGPWRAALGGSWVDALRFPLPDWPVLRRLGPLWVQRLIAQAVINRYAWMREARIPVLPRFEEDSVICWDDLLTQPAERQCLQEADEWELSRLFGVYLDWLMQMLDLPEGEADAWLRVSALVGICGRFAQIYAEWKRRAGAAQARTIVREDLRHYLGPMARVA